MISFMIQKTIFDDWIFTLIADFDANFKFDFYKLVKLIFNE